MGLWHIILLGGEHMRAHARGHTPCFLCVFFLKKVRQRKKKKTHRIHTVPFMIEVDGVWLHTHTHTYTHTQSRSSRRWSMARTSDVSPSFRYT